MTIHATTVAGVLDRAAEATPDAIAFVCDDEQVTFEQLRTRAQSVAAALVRRGLEPRQHLGVWMHNSVDYVVVVYAAAYLDVVLVPMNTWHRAREMQYAVRQSEISMLVFADAIAGRSGSEAVDEFLTDRREFPHLVEVVSMSELEGNGPHRLNLEGQPARRPGDCTYILYTSGTTGNAKGVMLDDLGVVTDARLLAERLGVGADDSYYCPVPLFHAGGLIFVLLAAHVNGARVVTRSRFDAAEALVDIANHGCTLIGGFEVGFARLLDAIEDGGPRPTTLRSGWWVGTPAAMLRSESGLGLRLANLYGMTEASGNVAATPLEWDAAVRSTVQGTPLTDRVVEIVDPATDQVLEPGGVGEIRVSGWGLFHGYWRMEEASAAKRDAQGRLRSGDLGMLDDSGCLHFLGRADDALKVGGENVAPLEIEEVLAEHDAVDEVAVFGVPDERYGQRVVAVVRLHPGRSSSEEALREHVRSHLSSFKVPKAVHLLSTDFPRTATGKIRKSELADLYFQPITTQEQS